MRDLTQSSNRELTLWVYNEPYFYNERENRDYLLALVAEEFYYTPEQLQDLIETLDEELAETKED